MIYGGADEINGFDVERIMGDLPIEVIKENIITQINDPLTYTTDYADDVYIVLDQAKEELDHIDQYREELNDELDKFNLFLLSNVESKFNLGIDVEELDAVDLDRLAKNCYSFFVVNLRENLENFLYNYITNNKVELANLFDSEYKRKDVTTMNMKKSLKSKEDVLVVSNLINVINYVLDLEFDASEFIDLCIEPGDYLGEEIKKSTDVFEISGDFVPPMIDELKINHNDIIDEIASSIRLSIIEENY